MKTSILTLSAAAFVLATSVGQTQAQQASDDGTMQQGQQGRMTQQGQQGPRMQQGTPGRMGPGMMGQGMMGQGMMGRGMMGRAGGGMGHGAMMPILFAIADADGDGALTLQEVQEIHARIFAHMDADDDGKLTPDETGDFFHGDKDTDGSEE